jgi:HEAT repeat protein
MQFPKFVTKLLRIQPEPERLVPPVQEIAKADPVVESLKNESSAVRRNAVSVLSRKLDSDPSVLGLLLDRLDDDSPDVRMTVLRELQTRIEDQKIRQNVLRMVDDDDPEVRWEARVISLGMKEQPDREKIFSFLKDSSLNNRRSFLLMTPPLQTEAERNQVIPFLSDPDPEVRQYALIAVNPTLQTPKEIEAILGTATLERDFDHHEYQNLAVQFLTERLQDSSAEVRSTAVRALKRSLSTSIGHTEANCIENQDFYWKPESTEHYFQHEALYKSIEPLFGDSDPQVRLAVVEAVGSFDFESCSFSFAHQGLVKAIEDSDTTVALAALRHLPADRLLEESVQKVSELAKSTENPEVRLQAENVVLTANRALGIREMGYFDQALKALVEAPPFHRDCLYGSVLKAGRGVVFADSEVIKVAPVSINPQTVAKLNGMILAENAIYQAQMTKIEPMAEFDDDALTDKRICIETLKFHEKNLNEVIGLVEGFLAHAPKQSQNSLNNSEKVSFTSNDAACVTTLLDQGIDVSLMEKVANAMRNTPDALPPFIKKLEKAVQGNLISGDTESERTRLQLAACRALVVGNQTAQLTESVTFASSPELKSAVDVGLWL